MVVGAGAVAVHLLELAACEILEAGVGQLLADGVVVLAGLLVGIEGGGGGVVDVDGGHNAHLVVLLGVELLGDGLIGHIAGPRTHIDDAALGLVAGGDGSGSGSGVGAERSAVVGAAVCIISDSVILRLCHPRKHYPLFLLLSDNHY